MSEQQNPESVEIAQDLQEKVATLQKFSLLHNVIHAGTFRVQDHVAVQEGLNLIKAIHEKVMQDAINHPDADKVPALKDEKEHRQKLIEELKSVESVGE